MDGGMWVMADDGWMDGEWGADGGGGMDSVRNDNRIFWWIDLGTPVSVIAEHC